MRLFTTVDRELGPLAALVNNAGIVDQKARLDEFSAARIQRMFAVNVLGSFLCAREAVRRMSRVHGGSGGVIVNLSSAAARLGSPGEYVDYAASKGAIDTMTIGLALEVASEGIRVNAVRPGLVDTDHPRPWGPTRPAGAAVPSGTDGPARRGPGSGAGHRLVVLTGGVLRDRCPDRRERRALTAHRPLGGGRVVDAGPIGHHGRSTDPRSHRPEEPPTRGDCVPEQPSPIITPAASTPWWRRGMLYQIYIRSFADSDGDGVGDLRGVIDHLDHLAWLGVDGIWLSPVTPSPNADFGYDVADYCAVEPAYGNLADLDELVASANAAGIQVLIDLVPNHSSDQHPWFVESRSGRERRPPGLLRVGRPQT